MKKFLCSIVTLLLIISMVPLGSFADNTVSIDQPILSIGSDNISSINAGGSKTIQFNLRNTGGNAHDVRVTPHFEEPFTSSNLTNNISVGNISRGGRSNISLDIGVSQDAKPGTYPIELTFDYNYYVRDRYEPGLEDPDYDPYYDPYYNQYRRGQLTPGSHKEIIYVKVLNNSTEPQLVISKVITDPPIVNPGQDMNLSLLFENKGTIEAKNISVKLEGLDSKEGFYMASGSDLSYVDKAPGKMVVSTKFHIKAAKSVKRGTHELEVVFKYGEIEERQKIYLTVGGKGSSDSNLIIENLEYPTTATAPNKDFTLTFDLRNNSDTDAMNVVVKPEASDEAIVPKSLSIKKIDTIAAGESESFSFTFSPTDDSITRNYPINIVVEYQDEFNEGTEVKHLVNQYVGMYVVNKSADESDSPKSKPRLIIDKYSFEPQLVKAGENFKMNLSFYNTNSKQSVKNIKIFLTAEPGSSTEDGTGNGSGSAFTPVDSSNTFYIDSIPPKGRVEKTITMFAVPDAIAKTHTITANFEYEDSESNELKDIELIGVPVIQQSRLDVGEVGYMPEAFIGESTPISLEFYNTGKVTLYNMMVKLEGDFQTENGQYYVGNFNSGSSEYFEGYVIPQEAGELAGEVVFTYEDSTGQVQEIRKDFNLNVMDMPIMDDDFMDEFPIDGQEESGIKRLLKNKIFWSIIALAAIVIGIIVFKKKKKQKELALDE